MLEKVIIQQFSNQVGFDACGVAPARFLLEDAAFFESWLQADYSGDMHYLARNVEKRLNPSLLLEGCKSVVVCLLNYFSTHQQPPNTLRVAKYAQATTNYHTVVKEKLQNLGSLLVNSYGKTLINTASQQLFCDTAPIFERRWAQLAGLGFIGENKQLISPPFGTYVHIGVLLLTEEVDGYDTPCLETCIGCKKCIATCPSGALSADGLFDARKCVSYLTTERKSPLTEEQNMLLTNVLIGCDICATCCPHNQNAIPNSHVGLQPNAMLLQITPEKWQSLSKRVQQKLVNRLAPK